MSADKHTPGPWTWFTDIVSDERDPAKRYIQNPDADKCKHFIGADGQGFALTVGLNRETDLANARLIAAAPDLLAALEACLPTLRGAIDDLQGETGELGRLRRQNERAFERAHAALAKARGKP